MIEDLEVLCPIDSCAWRGRLEILNQHIKDCQLYRCKKNNEPEWLKSSNKKNVEIIEIVDEPLVISDSDQINTCNFEFKESEFFCEQGPLGIFHPQERNQQAQSLSSWDSSNMNLNNFLTVDSASLASSAGTEECMFFFSIYFFSFTLQIQFPNSFL